MVLFWGLQNQPYFMYAFSMCKNGRKTDGTFTTGNAGRPKGSRNKRTIAIDSLLDGQAEALTQAAIDKALSGDAGALRLCLERLAPAVKDTPIKFPISKSSSDVDILNTAKAILEAASEGSITPIEASRAMVLVESYRKIFEASELEARIAALEAAHAKAN